jgi:hypothetical protein
VLDAEPPPGPADPGLDLVGDVQDPLLGAELAQRREEAVAGDDEPALAHDRLDDDGGDVLRADGRAHLVDRALGARRAAPIGRRPRGAAVRVGERQAVDLGSERPEALLVRSDLGGERHRQERPPVERVVEHHHGRPAGHVPGDLHRVLHGLGARVRQHRHLRVVAGGDLVELLRQGHVRLVQGDVEAGVGVPVDLLADRLDHRRRGVAGVQHGQAGGEVDEPVAVDVLDDRAARGLDEDGDGVEHRLGYGRLPAGQQLARAGSGDLGDQPAFLRDVHAMRSPRRILRHRPTPPSERPTNFVRVVCTDRMTPRAEPSGSGRHRLCTECTIRR